MGSGMIPSPHAIVSNQQAHQQAIWPLVGPVEALEWYNYSSMYA